MIIYRTMRRMVGPALICLLFILTVTAPAAPEELIREGDRLSLEKCLAIAQKMHPQIIAAENSLIAGKSRVGQARSDYYPQLKLSGDAGRTAPPGDKSPAYSQYSTAFNLSQNIFDFNRREAKVGIQELNAASAQADLEDARLSVALAVKQSYYERLRSEKTMEIAQETVDKFQRHLDTAKGFFETGLKPKIDVTKAEVDLSNARLNLLKAENALRLSIVKLNNSMGAPGAPPYEVEGAAETAVLLPEMEASLQRAYASRPDMRSLALKKEAAQRALELAGKDYYPVLSGKANYGWSGEDRPSDRSWNVGASIDFDLFTGFSTKYRVEEALANLQVIRANEEKLRQEIRLEVEQAFTGMQEAGKRIPTAGVAVRQAEENLDLAQARYAAGLGSPLEVTDALVARGNARNDLAGAVYDYNIAHANMEKAMGGM